MIALDFTLQQGTFTVDVHEQWEARVVALVGPSGAGKTTVLEAIAGLRHPSAGRIAVGGRVLCDTARGVALPPRLRRVGYVPQDAALFPHLDVRRNILYGTGRGEPLPLQHLVEILDIAPLVDRRVDMLSGGERQRVALARALMAAPDLLLLDEPLGGVDAPLRRRILADLQRVRTELDVPVVYVSHDPEDVLAFAQWTIVLARGRVTVSGPPSTVLR